MMRHTNNQKSNNNRASKRCGVWLFMIGCAVFLIGCNSFEKSPPEPFYSQTTPPPKQEFRWSNGKMPKSFDPALAAAPPETDVVRAIFEGLTDTDPQTLEAIPAAAEKWTSSDDLKTWTFYLRKEMRWSNGERITAQDFVRSWKRLAEMRDKVSHPELLSNIVGLKMPNEVVAPDIEDIEKKILPDANRSILPILPQSNTNSANTNAAVKTNKADKKAADQKDLKIASPTKFGVEAIDSYTLKVALVQPDKDFPKLVAHPIFRPIYGDAKNLDKLSADIVTNGAFRIVNVGQDGVTLDRAEDYWNRNQINLERVRFVPQENAEKALEAYRAGELDAITNIEFEPLALKLLATYDDFRRTEHAALNFYEINQNKPPFDDVRVRQALSAAIERKRLTEDEMDGASFPALSFLPFNADQKYLTEDKDAAKKFLTAAGFPNGENFPTIKLLINRNNIQQRIARRVARMWKQNLNIETEIVVKEPNEITAARDGEVFDVIRRGVVLPTSDEAAGMQAIAAITAKNPPEAHENLHEAAPSDQITGNSNIAVVPEKGESLANENPATGELSENPASAAAILTEAQAIDNLPAIPLYFPTTYSLIKPYVSGFQINSIDAPSLKNVFIDNDWQPSPPKGK